MNRDESRPLSRYRCFDEKGEEKKIKRSGENRVNALSEVNKKKKKKKGRGEAARWLRWSSNARTKGRRLSSAWTFHDGTSNGDARSSSCSLSFVLLLFRLLGSIIPRFRREPDAPLAKIRRWWWLIVLPLSRDNEIFVCAMRPPVKHSPLIRRSLFALTVNLPVPFIATAALYHRGSIIKASHCIELHQFRQ